MPMSLMRLQASPLPPVPVCQPQHSHGSQDQKLLKRAHATCMLLLLAGAAEDAFDPHRLAPPVSRKRRGNWRFLCGP